MTKDSLIFVAGHRGLVGSALVRQLKLQGYENILTRTRQEVDLTDQRQTREFMEQARPEIIFLAAAKVGGIGANSAAPVGFLLQNLQIQNNVMQSSFAVGVKKLLFLASSCVYPRLASQPMGEEALLTGPLEPTNEGYAIAKIAGVKLAEAYYLQEGASFVSLTPTNLYGPRDNFDPKSCHVLPALLRKFHHAKLAGAKTVDIWGSGSAQREFLHVDDLARACLLVLERYEGPEALNVGSGEELTIKELALLVKEVVGFEGGFQFDHSKPDGAPRKALDSSKIRALGWSPQVKMRDGLPAAYDWFLENVVDR